MQPLRSEVLTWEDVDRLIDHLLPQFEGEFEAMVVITRGGIIPGGLLAEAMGLTHILTAAVNFPAQMEMEKGNLGDLTQQSTLGRFNALRPLMAWPQFIQFPEDRALRGRRTLVVDDVWGSGRTITAVKIRVSAAGGFPFTCVLHFNPHRNLFGSTRPDYYAAITDAYIIYPWEIDRGPDRIKIGNIDDI
jgi:hypoxanthine phosphoribosyltransferase